MYPIYNIFSNVIHAHDCHIVLYFQIEKLEEAMAKENIPEDFELYKLISLLKKNDFIVAEVSSAKTIISILIIDYYYY